MTTHKREKALITLTRYIAKKIHRGQTNVNIQITKIKLTKGQNELSHGQPMSVRHTGKPVENDDARSGIGVGRT